MSAGAVVDEILFRWRWLAEDEKNGRVGAVCRRYFNHACALALGTRSYGNSVENSSTGTVCSPTLFITNTSLLPSITLLRTSSSTSLLLQPSGSLESRTWMMISLSSITLSKGLRWGLRIKCLFIFSRSLRTDDDGFSLSWRASASAALCTSVENVDVNAIVVSESG